MEELLIIEAIKTLKYRYLRAVDTHDWELMRSTLSDDCVARYDGGKYSFDGGDGVVAGIKSFMDSPDVVTQHNCHHPEIEVISDTEARAKWYLQDLVFNLKENWMLFGTAIYDDEYRKEDGQWKKCSTRYERIMETVTAPIPENLSFTHNMFAPK